MKVFYTRDFSEYRFKTIKDLAYALANAQYGNVVDFHLCEKGEYPAKVMAAFAYNSIDFISVKIDTVFEDKDFALCLTDGTDIRSKSLNIISRNAEDVPSNVSAICSQLCEWLNVTPSQGLFMRVPEDLIYEAIGDKYDEMEDPSLIFLADVEREEKYLIGAVDDNPVEAVRCACEFIKNNKDDIVDSYVVIEDDIGSAIVNIDEDYNLTIDEMIVLESAVEEMQAIAAEFRRDSGKNAGAKSKEIISYNVNEHTHELEIYLGDAILATVSDVYPHDDIKDIVDETLFGMGYEWNKDGTISHLKGVSGCIGSVQSGEIVSYSIDGYKQELTIYLNGAVIATIVHVCPNDDVINLVGATLYSKGYIWNKDGTASKM